MYCTKSPKILLVKALPVRSAPRSKDSPLKTKSPMFLILPSSISKTPENKELYLDK